MLQFFFVAFMTDNKSLSYAVLDKQKNLVQTNLSPECSKCLNECYSIASTLKLCLPHQEKRRQASFQQEEKNFYFCSAQEEDLQSPTKFQAKCHEKLKKLAESLKSSM